MALSIGNSGANVKSLQLALNAKIYWAPTDVKLVADGSFGAKTVSAVKLFQAQNGLPVTGIADNATAVKLGLFPSDVAAPTALSYSPSTIVPSTLVSPSSSPTFFETNKKNIMIAGGIFGGIVVLSIIVNAMKSTSAKA